jgi:hypothetical protein
MPILGFNQVKIHNLPPTFYHITPSKSSIFHGYLNNQIINLWKPLNQKSLFLRLRTIN